MVRDTVLPKDVTQRKHTVYRESNSGPRIDPWGTPHTKETDMVEKNCLYSQQMSYPFDRRQTTEKPTKTLKINTITSIPAALDLF